MNKLGFMYAIGAAISWGFVYALSQKILTKFSPIYFLFISSVVTVIVLLPYVLLNSPQINIFNVNKNDLILTIVAIFGGIAANILIFSAIKTLGASYASFLEISYPFFVVLFSVILFKTSPNIYFYIGGLLIFIGSFIITKLG